MGVSEAAERALRWGWLAKEVPGLLAGFLKVELEAISPAPPPAVPFTCAEARLTESSPRHMSACAARSWSAGQWPRGLGNTWTLENRVVHQEFLSRGYLSALRGCDQSSRQGQFRGGEVDFGSRHLWLTTPVVLAGSEAEHHGGRLGRGCHSRHGYQSGGEGLWGMGPSRASSATSSSLAPPAFSYHPSVPSNLAGLVRWQLSRSSHFASEYPCTSTGALGTPRTLTTAGAEWWKGGDGTPPHGRSLFRGSLASSAPGQGGGDSLPQSPRASVSGSLWSSGPEMGHLELKAPTCGTVPLERT